MAYNTHTDNFNLDACFLLQHGSNQRKKYLELCKALIEQGQELAQIQKEKAGLEWQLSNKMGQLKKITY